MKFLSKISRLVMGSSGGTIFDKGECCKIDLWRFRELVMARGSKISRLVMGFFVCRKFGTPLEMGIQKGLNSLLAGVSGDP